MSYTSLSRLFIATCGLAVVAAVTPAHAIDPKLLPPDAEVVLTINLRQVLNSDLAKSNQEVVRQLRTMVEGHLADADAQRYLEKIDFDILRDLDRITVATSGSKMPEFLMLEGKFNPEKIAATGKEAVDEHPDHIKAIKIDGQQAYEIRVDTNENPVYAGLVGKDKLIVTQTKDGFADAVARIKSSAKATGKLKNGLRDALAASDANASASLVATGGGLVKLTEDTAVPNIDQLQRGVLEKITSLSFAVTLQKDVGFALVVNAKDKMASDEIATLANVGVAGAKMLLKNKAEKDPKTVPALKVVETLRVTSKGNTISLTGRASAEMLGKLIKALPKS